MNFEHIKGAVGFTPKDARYQGERIDALDSHLDRMLKKDELVSYCYTLSRDGKIFANNSAGDLSYEREDGRPFLPDSIFAICSITKVFTGIAILKLCEDGLMRLDQPVGDFLDEFKKDPLKKITVLQLLNHTSGLIPDGGALHNDYYVDWDKFVDENDIAGTWITAICKQGVRREPGDEWCYCSTGFVLLGEIITRVSGVKCEQYIEDYICKPCGMTDTSFEIDISKADRYCLQWPKFKEELEERKAGTYQPKPWRGIVPHTAGGLLSTTSDLSLFAQMILNNGTINGKRVIGRKALEAMCRPSTDPRVVRNFAWDNGGAYKCYGVGIDIWTWDDKAQLITPGLVNHEGYGSCCMMIDREEGFSAVWSVQYRDLDNWLAHSLRNVSSVIWSGLV